MPAGGKPTATGILTETVRQMQAEIEHLLASDKHATAELDVRVLPHGKDHAVEVADTGAVTIEHVEILWPDDSDNWHVPRLVA